MGPSPAARRREKAAEKDLARERIAKLEALAERAALAGRLDRAARYGALARGLAMRVQAPMPRSLARRLCAGCGAYLLPGASARVRARPGRILVTCLACGETKRLPHGARPKPAGPRARPRPPEG